MSRDNPKAPTPVPQAAASNQALGKKKFSFSFSFLRKSNAEKGFESKVAPSRRELEVRATKRKTQKDKEQGGLKLAPALAAEPEEQELQPV